MQQRLAYGKPTIAAVGITRPDGGVDSVSTEIEVHDLLIAGMGDSVAAGEGNPDRPIALADEGFCFRRFLGAARSEYFRPSRLGYKSDKACDDNPPAPPPRPPTGTATARAGCRRPATVRCTAISFAPRSRSRSRTRKSRSPSCRSRAAGRRSRAGCSARKAPATARRAGRCDGTVSPQIDQLKDILGKARQQLPSRKLDLVLLTVGANDIKFAGLVADVIISSGVERTLFNQGGQLATVPQAQTILDRELPGNFAKLRTALKPLVGGNLSRVVLRVLRPSGDAGRRAVPRRARRPRYPSGVHRRRHAA